MGATNGNGSTPTPGTLTTPLLHNGSASARVQEQVDVSTCSKRLLKLGQGRENTRSEKYKVAVPRIGKTLYN
jgi:hypothetical protein